MEKSPLEVGEILVLDRYGETQRGLMMIADDYEAQPFKMVPVPEEMRNEYRFMAVLSPQTAFFIGALPAHEAGMEMKPVVLEASKVMWWFMTTLGSQLWREMEHDEND